MYTFTEKEENTFDWSTTNPTLTGYQHSLSHVILQGLVIVRQNYYFFSITIQI